MHFNLHSFELVGIEVAVAIHGYVLGAIAVDDGGRDVSSKLR